MTSFTSLRKEGLLLLALFFTYFSEAQIGPGNGGTFESQINQVFSGIDKSRIPHDLLLDYAMEFAELPAYGTTLTDDNLVHKGTLTSIYNTLLMARTTAGVPDLVPPATFRSNWQNERAVDKIALSGLYYIYSRIKSNAYPNSLSVINNTYHDKYVNGIWQNPYETKKVFAMAAPIIKFKKLTVDVEIPASLWYTNQAGAVQTIQIDFGDGNGYQNMPFNSTTRVSYPSSGLYEWKYKLSLTNREVLYSHSKIEIEGTNQISARTGGALSNRRLITEPCNSNTPIDEVFFQGTTTYNGTTNSATLEIDYALNDCTIRKPLIVAEGFDSGLLGMENGLGDVGYERFIRNATILTGALSGEITSYDIIYINWNNAQDDLRRNAALLKDIIAWVNQEKVTTTDNVVLGQSMGGLIARYALADMEQNGPAHDTRLYISHDAPHQGANIPLSILAFARHLSDEFVTTPLGDIDISMGQGSPVSIADLQGLINATATKQLLTSSIDSGLTLSTAVFDEWQSDYNLKGYPQLTRNISLSNGSHCGNPQADINPSDIIFSIDGEGKTSLLTDFLLELIPFSDVGFIALAVIFNEPGLLIGTLPGNSSFDLEFECKALPTVGIGSKIYDGKVSFTKKLLWLLDITVNLTDEEYTSPNNYLSFDFYPGGRYDVPIDLGNSSIGNALANLNITTNAVDNFGFIPTPSSLDVGSNNIVLTEEDYLRNYNAVQPPTGAKAIPFNNFFTAFQNNNSLNEEHISFNFRNGNWLETELNLANNVDIFDCSVVCDNLAIEGSDYLCNSDTYYLDIDPASFTNINWSVSDTNAVTVVSTLDASVTLQATSGYRTTISLTATINVSSRCGGGTFQVTRDDIRVGAPGLPGSLNGPSEVETGALVTYTAGVSQGATAYKWRLPHPFLNVSQYDYNANEWQLRNPGNFRIQSVYSGMGEISGLVQVSGINPCGEGGSQMMNVVHQSGGGGGIPFQEGDDNVSETRTIAYPNPTSSLVNIDIKEMYRNDGETIIETIRIYDIRMTEQRYLLTRDRIDSNTLDVSSLEKGLYFVHITTNKGIEVKKLLIN